jgi:hypothetical protein
MALYAFRLEQFHIDTTRSRHEDTDTVAFVVQAGSSQPLLQSKFIGDVNNGDHQVSMLSPPLFLAAQAKPAVFSYMIYNGQTTNLGISLGDLANKVIDSYTQQILEGGPSRDPQVEIPDNPEPWPDNATFDNTSWINVLGLATIGSFFFPDCDGMVVADVIGRSKSELDNAIDSAGGKSYKQTRRYPGTDSPAGCGSNSDYTVTWSVTRFRETGPGPHSLREFLRSNHLTLEPGIRSLNGGQPMRVRDLLT